MRVDRPQRPRRLRRPCLGRRLARRSADRPALGQPGSPAVGQPGSGQHKSTGTHLRGQGERWPRYHQGKELKETSWQASQHRRGCQRSSSPAAGVGAHVVQQPDVPSAFFLALAPLGFFPCLLVKGHSRKLPIHAHSRGSALQCTRGCQDLT